MERSEFNELLQAADAASPQPRFDRELSSKVRGRARRGRTWRIASASFAVAILGGIAVWNSWHASSAQARTDEIAVARPSELHASSAELFHELKCIRKEAELHAALAERLTHTEQATLWREQLRKALARPGAMDELAAENDRAAATLLYHGDRQREQQDTKEAARSYRLVLASFAESRPAAAARERLRSLRGGE
jgi:hypothetical protein